MSRKELHSRRQWSKQDKVAFRLMILMVLTYSIYVFFIGLSNDVEKDTRNIATDLRDYLEENGKEISMQDALAIIWIYQDNHIIKHNNIVERKIIRQYLEGNNIDQIKTIEKRYQEICKNLVQLNMSLIFGVIATLIALATLKPMDKSELIKLTNTTLIFIAYNIIMFTGSYSELGGTWVYKSFIAGSIFAQIATLWITFWIIDSSNEKPIK